MDYLSFTVYLACYSYIRPKERILRFLHCFILTFIMGRPSKKPKDLRDGYYIEVRNKNQRSGIKIRRDTKEQLLQAIEEYKESKEVIILGKSENGKMKDIPDLKIG